MVTDRSATDGRFERPNDTVLEFSGVPLPDGAMLMIYLDVTDTSKIARALTERAEALETADRLKSEFIQRMSYELRTPLNTIIGFSEILSNEYFGDLNAEQREYTAGIFDASQQLLSLVNDVLDLAMVEGGALELDVGEVDICRLLDGVVTLVNDQVTKNELTVVIDRPDDIGSLEGDERRIRQVLFNLLSNAIKFNVAGGRIGLGARRNGSWISLWVEDTGQGIHADEQVRVFEKFETGKQVQRYRGAGLGLSLVRSFVELHGGRVELRSRPDKGTRVTCFLPLVPNLAPDGKPSATGRTQINCPNWRRQRRTSPREPSPLFPSVGDTWLQRLGPRATNYLWRNRILPRRYTRAQSHARLATWPRCARSRKSWRRWPRLGTSSHSRARSAPGRRPLPDFSSPGSAIKRMSQVRHLIWSKPTRGSNFRFGILTSIASPVPTKFMSWASSRPLTRA